MSIVDELRQRHQYIEEVAAYIRVSTQEQKLHGISLEAQVEKLEEYASKHNMKIVEWYKDEGVSGRKLIRKRPELQRMIHDAQKGKFKRIIFIKLDRFFRSVAEYHECMKLIAPVIWTATEEKYDLSTASGKAFVNMKLTIAELEADQTGERIHLVNEYKVKTGQPLTGNQPWCYTVGTPETGERHKYVKKANEEIMNDLIAHFRTHKTIRGAMLYVNKKYNRKFSYNSIYNILTNEMICGSYRGNPNYCDPYMTREEFIQMQTFIARNPRTTYGNVYLFSGLIVCPHCGARLTSCNQNSYSRPDPITGKRKVQKTYLAYRCTQAKIYHQCDFTKNPPESKVEELLLDNLEKIIRQKKLQATKVVSGEERIGKYNLQELQEELDRLNYSWKKGRIKNVEDYDRQYDELMALIDAAHEEEEEIDKGPDFEAIQNMLAEGWQDFYNDLTKEEKRSFWRSFIDCIYIDWNGREKKILDIDFL